MPAEPTASAPDAYLSPERVLASVEALAQLKPGRIKQATLIKWLLLKALGLRPGVSVSATSEDIKLVAERYFGWSQDAASARDYGYFSPFEKQWFGRYGGTDWAGQTLWSQYQRPNKGDKQLYEPVGPTTTPTGGDMLQLRCAIKADSDYPRTLTTAVLGAGGKIPPRDFAIWRFRTEHLSPDASVESLTVALLSDLHVNAEEYAAVFQSDAEIEKIAFAPVEA